jgi:nitroimidazol reductase NimA-like FMN-containing flavoprotein (pyridoxamine 5'-phosphate oxidase superfamily)
MRRKENEITDPAEIIDIIRRSQVCRLAMCEGDQPYVIPVSFGFRDDKLYIHSSLAGRKIDVLNKNNNVCVEFDIDDQIVKTEKACTWGFKYKSVIGYGSAHFVYDYDEKIKALDIIMSQYSDNEFKYEKKQVEACLIIRIDIKKLTGKRSK